MSTKRASTYEERRKQHKPIFKSRAERKAAGEWYLGEQFSESGRAAAGKRAKANRVKRAKLKADQKESARLAGEKRRTSKVTRKSKKVDQKGKGVGSIKTTSIAKVQKGKIDKKSGRIRTLEQKSMAIPEDKKTKWKEAYTQVDPRHSVKKTKGGDYQAYKEGTEAASSFKEAFKKNCAKGTGKKDTFSWDGRKYTCERG